VATGLVTEAEVLEAPQGAAFPSYGQTRSRAAGSFGQCRREIAVGETQVDVEMIWVLQIAAETDLAAPRTDQRRDDDVRLQSALIGKSCGRQQNGVPARR